jgi:hypothetical protein
MNKNVARVRTVSVGRREALRHATAGVVALAVGGCGGGGASDPAQTATPSAGGTSPVVPPMPGSQSLVISGISVDALSSSSASIHWQTDRAATAEVEYGTSAAYGQRAGASTGLSDRHTVALSGLQPGTTYHYRVVSRDAAGAMVAGPGATFITSGPAPAGRATLAWDGPTQNADSAASPLTDLAGYRLYMSTTSGNYPGVAARQVNATAVGGTLQATVTGLARGTHFFVVTAIDAYGNESARSEELAVVIS